MSGILQYKVPSLVQSSLQNAPFRSKPEKDISEYTSKQSRLTSHMNFCVQIDNHFIVFPWTIVWLFIIFYDLRTYFSSFVQLKNDYYMRKIISNDILQFKEELCHYSILSYPFFCIFKHYLLIIFNFVCNWSLLLGTDFLQFGCTGLSLLWLRLSWSIGSRSRLQCGTTTCVGLVVPRHVESSQTWNRTLVPFIGWQSLNHWNTRTLLSFPL